MMQPQRGFALIIAVVLIAIMSMLGFIVLDAVVGDLGMVSAARQKETALYVAEGGIAWAVDQIDLAFANETAFGDLTLSALNLGNVADVHDPGCPNAECKVLLQPAGWRRMTATSNPMAYSSGEFFVYIRDDDDGDENSDVDTNGTVLLRSIGRSGKSSGASRVLEVAIQIGR